jgi:hypothetical protein
VDIFLNQRNRRRDPPNPHFETPHPRIAFRRAIDVRQPVVAELEAREAGRLELDEALELTALIALRDPERGQRYAVRWLKRCLDETMA